MTDQFLPDNEDAAHFENVMAFERVEWREGFVRYRVQLKPQHRNRQGIVHGGVIGALLDAAGLYAGGFAALTVLRNEAAAAVAIGVDMGKRVASVLEGWCCNSAPTEKVGGPIPSSEEMEAISWEAEDTPNTPSSPHVGAAAVGHAPSSWRGRWAAMLLLGGCIGVFVLLACVFVHSTRVASLCVLAAQSLVESLASLLGGPTPGAHTQCPPPSVHSALSTLNATDDCIVCASGPTASRFGPGGRGHALAVCGLSALGMLIQYTRHTRGSHAHSAHLPRVCIQHSL